MRKIYYAHAICLYGRADERKELSRIRKRFSRVIVINPAKYDGHPDKQTDTVGFCLRLIDKCDVVVFSRLLGKITAGVGKEVNHALKNGKSVFELTADKIKPRTRRVKYASRAATRSLYPEYRLSLWFVPLRYSSQAPTPGIAAMKCPYCCETGDLMRHAPRPSA